jgi:hypothetical protein
VTVVTSGSDAFRIGWARSAANCISQAGSFLQRCEEMLRQKSTMIGELMQISAKSRQNDGA